MCASFTVQTHADEISKIINLKIPDELLSKSWDFHPLGYMKTHEAPVIIGNHNGEKEVRLMKFSLCPFWSKDYPFKASSYNARMERPKNIPLLKKSLSKDKKRELNQNNNEFHSQIHNQTNSEIHCKESEVEYIYQIPTWKYSFNNGQTCLVPMNGAIESCHFGNRKGKVIKVTQKNDEVFFAVGIWSEWVEKATGALIESFALITDHPYQYFFNEGHERSIFILNTGQYDTWLFNKTMSPQERFHLLRKYRISLDWKSTPIRNLKKTKLYTDEELMKIKIWKPDSDL